MLRLVDKKQFQDDMRNKTTNRSGNGCLIFDDKSFDED